MLALGGREIDRLFCLAGMHIVGRMQRGFDDQSFCLLGTELAVCLHGSKDGTSIYNKVGRRATACLIKAEGTYSRPVGDTYCKPTATWLVAGSNWL